jgi:precorrin-2/cobalt-factor-2 C20-methyltransferase
MSALETIAGTATPGTLYGVGVGPGDVRYVTLRAAGIIQSVELLVYFAKRGRQSNARRVVAPLVAAGRSELALEYPVTGELPVEHPNYRAQITSFYRDSAEQLAGHLGRGRSVGVLSEGDPFFYGSSMYVFDRLQHAFPTEVVPGVTGMGGCWSRAALPITRGDDVLAVLPGTLGEADLVDRLTGCDAAIIMKLGRNMPKVLAALARTGLADRAIYVERGTMAEERILPVAAMVGQVAPYFSLVLVPGGERRR